MGQAFKEQISSLKLFQITENQRTLPNSFWKASIAIIPKGRYGHSKDKHLQGNFSHEHGCKNHR